MRVDFYQLSRDPAEKVLPLLARNTLKAGERLLAVSADEAQLARIGDALWEPRESFLANGRAGGPHDARQPVLLSDRVEPANGARYFAIADGLWREGLFLGLGGRIILPPQPPEAEHGTRYDRCGGVSQVSPASRHGRPR